jgi:hypothetical protein
MGTSLSAPVRTGPGVHPTSSTMSAGSFMRVMRPGRGVEHLPQFFAILKKEQSYTYILRMGFHGLFQEEVYLLFIFWHR